MRAYERAGRVGVEHPDLAVLAALRDELVERGITVTRFARVACPGSGTTLASRRVDRYATYLFNVLRCPRPRRPDLGVAAVVEKLLLTLLDQRSGRGSSRASKAQMPESPFIAMLNTATPIADGLGSIVGDIEGIGILKRLKVLGADLFREDHDLVVNTSAMTAGVPRTFPADPLPGRRRQPHVVLRERRQSDRGARLDHVPVQRRPRVHLAPERLAGTSRSIGDSERRAASSGVVVVVPDLMGSGLVDVVEGGPLEVWPNVSGVTEGGVDHLGVRPGREQRCAQDRPRRAGPVRTRRCSTDCA